MIAIISAAIAPGLALLSYFYLRDQYDTEPVFTVLRAFILGLAITFPVMFFQYVLEEEVVFSNLILQSFLSYGLLEEFFKWFILYFYIIHLIEFDEPYDGIVYGAAVSLGFATLENLLFLAVFGLETAVGRALLPVSSHALFGVVMGYYIGKAKFTKDRNKKRLIFISLALPVTLHTLYDYILVSSVHWIYYIIPFMLFLWWLGLWKVKKAHILTHQHHQLSK
ncbi:glutamic-type intramembrane protease PrsW [Jeotgalibacillus sp. R-1-5s-1]|uniref:glutamic-type intramembrane protease PrsW n=1 Tax=Jeotgalibacillus sp. R-1-5s-1 TaxID=2555897 RepID=UPI00106CEEA0|nr:glutamic-type intramembrane protease PrsW [Jeotgalibacillus sp. R-1-5s-1]TFE00429.1 intramembrane metalloprotease PrsW [Jeotgalibacillus sp. R-1-5s-1]